MRRYEGGKGASGGWRGSGGASGSGGGGRPSAASAPGAVTKDNDDGDEKAKDGDSDGMMAGVVAGAQKQDESKKLLPVTAWGRYLKTLLSSNGFLFIS